MTCDHGNGGNGAARSDFEAAPKGDLTIPPCLDRRHEVCDQCGQPGGTEWDYLGTKVRLHERCERAWIDFRCNSGMACMGAQS